ncbi:uncharacterized protein PHALS_15165 [Plasmopara halstedii]|uniref:Uncharacterized protein n=1 Tax=Plasmopara halstedii TaxID=4781 RepID=A0A0P1B397_PLAHL|nr:uncharacterized protein PHALS_15165 [Plasmopara halstedii]CEG48718.1 hypothetical protein PHALS_15165 [Plasmopara halstedii]|eukprot:XP_024585087.1 hypothetical protein PHALS_15165 [Plasmopara halstedii]
MGSHDVVIHTSEISIRHTALTWFFTQQRERHVILVAVNSRLSTARSGWVHMTWLFIPGIFSDKSASA